MEPFHGDFFDFLVQTNICKKLLYPDLRGVFDPKIAGRATMLRVLMFAVHGSWTVEYERVLMELNYGECQNVLDILTGRHDSVTFAWTGFVIAT